MAPRVAPAACAMSCSEVRDTPWLSNSRSAASISALRVACASALVRRAMGWLESLAGHTIQQHTYINVCIIAHPKSLSCPRSQGFYGPMTCASHAFTRLAGLAVASASKDHHATVPLPLPF